MSHPMTNCPSCLSVLPEKSHSCPVCGTSFRLSSSDPSELLGLLAEEFTRALHEGKVPDIEEYAQRYPEICLQIRELFPTIVALEDAAKEQGHEGSTASDKDVSGDSSSSPSALAPGRFVAGTIL
jgi:hypothetical protein